jgi:hypothetical protein
MFHRPLAAVACLVAFSSLASAAAPAKSNTPASAKTSPPPPAEVDLAAAAASTAAHGWIDLIRDPSLADWQRKSPLASATLDPRSPWRFDRAEGCLRFDGTGQHEVLLHATPRGDGIFRVEWRFVGTPAKPNATLLVRTTPDLATSHRATLAPPLLGTLTGTRLDPDGSSKRLNLGSRRPNLLRKTGEWNVLEIVCLGSRLSLQCNGTPTTTWNDCPVPSGYFGLESDGTPVEFRTVKFKPLRP